MGIPVIMDLMSDLISVSVRDHGAKGDGSTDDTAAFEAACLQDGPTEVPKGRYILRRPMRLPPGKHLVGREGENPVLVFVGPTYGFHTMIAGFATGPLIRGLTIAGAEGAKIGLAVNMRQMTRLERVYFQGWTEQALLIQDCINVVFDQCLFTGCGAKWSAQVEVERTTGFSWRDTYISTGNAGVGSDPGTCAGLRLDDCGPFSIAGGAIESTGVAIALGTKKGANVGPGVISGVGFERPDGRYFDVGKGVHDVTVIGCDGTISGATGKVVTVRGGAGLSFIGSRFVEQAG